MRRGSVKSARYAARKAAGVTAASQACQGCGEVKPASEYRNNWHRPSGLDYFCHECESAKKRESIHGVSQTEYEAKLAAQGGVCAICRRPEMTRANKGDRLKCLAQDHNHNTGQRRGLLCANCNKGIGNLGDDPERLIAAAAYLIEYAAVEGG